MKLTLKQRQALLALPQSASFEDNYYQTRLERLIKLEPNELKNFQTAGVKFFRTPDGVLDWEDEKTDLEFDLSKFDKYLRQSLGVMSDNGKLHKSLNDLFFHYHPEELHRLEKEFEDKN